MERGSSAEKNHVSLNEKRREGTAAECSNLYFFLFSENRERIIRETVRGTLPAILRRANQEIIALLSFMKHVSHDTIITSLHLVLMRFDMEKSFMLSFRYMQK